MTRQKEKQDGRVLPRCSGSACMAGAAFECLPPGIAEQVYEIRLRAGCGVQLTIGGKPCCPAKLPALQTLRLTPLQMEEIFVTLCGGSVHSHETEIAAGYVTLSCGCRAAGPDSFTAHRGRAPSCRSCAR